MNVRNKIIRNDDVYKKTQNVNEFLTKSCGEMYTTRITQIKVDDKFVDDGSINEIKMERICSGESPRSVLKKRCKSAEIH